MPTGYTARLESMGYNTKRWLKEAVIRAMGVCITLRDDGDLSEPEIRARLAMDTGESFYSKHLRLAQEELARLQGLTPAGWEAEWGAEAAAAVKAYDARMKEHAEKKANHERSIQETAAMLATAEQGRQGEVVVNTLKFALAQLRQAYEFDYSSLPYREAVLDQTVVQYQAARLEAVRRNVDTYSKEKAAEISRTTNRLAEYDHFATFVDNQ